MTDKAKLEAIRAEIHRLVDVRGYDREMANDLLVFMDSLPNEPVSEELIDVAKQYVKDHVIGIDKVTFSIATDMFISGANWQKQKDSIVSEELEEAAKERVDAEDYCCVNDDGMPLYDCDYLEYMFKEGAKWQKENLWKPADGDDLPEIDIEVIALLDNGKVVFAHRPPEYWDGKDIVTGKVTRNYPKTYDKGGWNIPNVKWWLDCLLPNMEED